MPSRTVAQMADEVRGMTVGQKKAWFTTLPLADQKRLEIAFVYTDQIRNPPRTQGQRPDLDLYDSVCR